MAALGTAVDVLAGRRLVLALARETAAVRVESVYRFVRSKDRILRRAVVAGCVRPELQACDLAAVIFMAPATVHAGDPGGADRKRYPALLVDGLRPSPAALPAPSAAGGNRPGD